MKKTPNEVIAIITDVATIVFPGATAIVVALHLTNVLPALETAESIALIALNVAAGVASIIYNKVTKKA